ncbi:MAG: CidA/LrgA family protein [Oscillibacter sp.]|nr:CidA/LrgA family protein [Oscillibacter sp.]
MKLIAQAGVVFAICWISLCIERILPFAMPASIIGMLLLLLLLTVRLVKVEWVEDLADLLLGNLQFFFVPAVVSIIQYLDVLRQSWAAIVIICVVTTVVTFAAAVLAVRLTLRWMERRRK